MGNARAPQPLTRASLKCIELYKGQSRTPILAVLARSSWQHVVQRAPSRQARLPPPPTHQPTHRPTAPPSLLARSAATPRTGAEDEWNFGVEPRFGVEPGSTLGAGSTPNCPAPRPEEPGSTPSPSPPDRASERASERGARLLTERSRPKFLGEPEAWRHESLLMVHLLTPARAQSRARGG